MKTQIILRIILIIIALFVFTNNTGSSVRTSKDIKTVHSVNAASSEHDSKDNKATEHGNKENPAPYVPDTHHDHDFDCFDFKHHEKRIFWRCIANKAFALIYHLTVLCALISQFLIH